MPSPPDVAVSIGKTHPSGLELQLEPGSGGVGAAACSDGITVDIENLRSTIGRKLVTARGQYQSPSAFLLPAKAPVETLRR